MNIVSSSLWTANLCIQSFRTTRDFAPLNISSTNGRSWIPQHTHTLLRMAQLVLTLNKFVFNGEHYQQIGAVARGSKLGQNYACLFVGYVEEKMLRDYTGIKPDLYKRYMDDEAGAASCAEDDLTRFLTFASSYHPKLEYTWSISSAKLPFLDMFLIPRDDRVATSIHYKETDNHSCLNFKSSHPFKCKASILTS